MGDREGNAVVSSVI